jgi:hypothetical protein
VSPLLEALTADPIDPPANTSRIVPVVVVDVVIVQLYVAEAVPPEPVAVATNVCGPAASELSEVGLVQTAPAPLSRWQDTDVVFRADQANVAVVAVVDAAGVCVKEITGGAHVVDVLIVQLYVADALPPGPVAVATKVCVPTVSELSEVGLVQADAAPLSSLHDTALVLSADQANVAVVDVVDAAGVWVKEMTGAGVVGGVGVEDRIVHLTSALGCELCAGARAKECAPSTRFV